MPDLDPPSSPEEAPEAADPWAEADRAWANPPDHWARADREWDARGYTPPADPDPQRLLPPSKSIGKSYSDGMSAAGPYIGLGAQIAGTMLASVGLGILVDRWAGTGPWGVIGGAAFGLVALVALVVRLSAEATPRAGPKKGRPV